MKVVVTGGGAVGRHLAQDLTDRGHDVTLVEQRRELAEKLGQWAPDTRIVYGDACEPRILEKADVRSADVVVAATGDDEDNLVTSLLAKQEFGVPRVLARVNHPKNEWLFDEQWGVDASVSPPHILTAMVEEAVTVGDLVRLLRLEGGKVALVEMRLPEQSPNVGRALYELRLPTDTTLVAILREGHVMIPQPETALAAGDEIVALSSVDSEAALRDTVMGTGAGARADTPDAPTTPDAEVRLAGELQARVDHPDLSAVIGEDPVDHHALAQGEAADPAAAHEHDHHLSRPVRDQRLQRLLALHGEDRHPADHAGDPHRLSNRCGGDPDGALDRLGPGSGLFGETRLIALVEPLEEPTDQAHVTKGWALRPRPAA